jgi:hypothetical protein
MLTKSDDREELFSTAKRSVRGLVEGLKGALISLEQWLNYLEQPVNYYSRLFFWESLNEPFLKIK